MVMDETDVQGPEQEKVQAIHAEWVQELRDVKNELMHVRKLVGVLVRRERCAETKTEIAARRLDRMEREQTEADDAEHEANLQEALANQSKAVRWLSTNGSSTRAMASEKPRKAKSSSSTLAPRRVLKCSRSALMRGCRW